MMAGQTGVKPERAAGYRLLSRCRPELMGAAMLWVMLFHAYELHFGVPVLDAVKALGFGGVDIFILLSGMGLYISLATTQRSYLSYCRRRLKRILPAYWLVVGTYSLWLRLQGRISLRVAAWSLSTLHYWFHIPGSFNWYVPAVLAFYLLAPFWVRLLRRSGHPEWLTVLAFPVSYGLYRLSIPLGLNYMEDFLYRIPTFAVGLLAGSYILSGRKLTARHAAAWACGALCGIALGVLRLRGVLYINTCYMVSACIMPLCLLLAKAVDLLRWDWPRRLLRLLGTCSLEIYLLNVVVTREFATLAPWLDRDGRHIVYYCTVYGLNILLAVLLHRGIGAVSARLEKKI